MQFRKHVLEKLNNELALKVSIDSDTDNRLAFSMIAATLILSWPVPEGKIESVNQRDCYDL